MAGAYHFNPETEKKQINKITVDGLAARMPSPSKVTHIAVMRETMVNDGNDLLESGG